MIATSKLDSYAWQNESRLVFSLTDALTFEKVDIRLVHRSNPREPAKPDEHHEYLVNAQSLGDICRVHEFDTGSWLRTERRLLPRRAMHEGNRRDNRDVPKGIEYE